MTDNTNEGLVTGPPHRPDAPSPAAPSGAHEQPPDPACDHDWTVVNRDENRLIHKCRKCGGIRRE